MKNKRILLMFIAVLAIIMLSGHIPSYAALQSNPTTYANPKKDAPQNWIKLFRNIETTQGGLGYSETYNSSTLVPTSNSNGIDIHMMKSTEYGLMAILAVSGYGNPTTSGTMESTTGNNTGVMLSQSSWEYVAGGLDGYAFKGIDNRYYDSYTNSQASAKRGDALGTANTINPGCSGWRNGYNHWIESSGLVFLRGAKNVNGLFSYNYNNVDGSYSGAGRDTYYYSRGVAVVGEGL